MPLFRLEPKLDRWVEAGLLEEKQAADILDYEGEASRPLLLWALTGLGALAILLGAASLIAANWENIAGVLRLAVHLIVFTGMCLVHAVLVRRTRTSGQDWFHDARLWLIAGLGLAFFFHLEQVYDRDNPLWQIMLAWLIAFSPILLGTGRTVSVAIGWMAGLVTFSVAFVATGVDRLSGLGALSWNDGLLWALVLAQPSAAGLASLYLDRKRDAGDFNLQIAAIGFYWQFVLANYFYLWGRSIWDEQAGALIRLDLPLAAILVVLVLSCLPLLERKEGRALAGMTLISALLLVLAPYRPQDALGALIFLAAWAGIALLSLSPGWRQIFQAAVGLIALRLVILTFELSDNLLGSGVGFILAGIALFVFASIAIRVGKGFAPDRRKGTP